jgi:hypothetical protein
VPAPLRLRSPGGEETKRLVKLGAFDELIDECVRGNGLHSESSSCPRLVCMPDWLVSFAIIIVVVVIILWLIDQA